MTGTFELQLYDESDNEYLIEVEFNVFGRYDPGDYMTPPSEPEVELHSSTLFHDPWACPSRKSYTLRLTCSGSATC